MNARIEVRTQAEMEAAIAAGDIPVLSANITFEIKSGSPRVVANGSSQPRVVANGSSQPRVVANGSSQPTVVANDSSQPRVVANDSSQPTVVAYGSSQPTVEANDSSQPTVEANDSSQPRVVANGSSQPTVVANDSSQPRVVANGSSQPRVVANDSSQPTVEAYGSSQPTVEANDSSQPRVVANDSSQPRVVANGICRVVVTGKVKVVAGAMVAIAVLGGKPDITGGGFVARQDVSTPAKWCDFYGARVVNGVATLFKVVGLDYKTPQRRFAYVPGTVPKAPDWDGGARECGGGLHFSPTPNSTLTFADGLARGNRKFIACPVRLSDMVVHPEGSYPQKCKAPGLAGPCWEVNEDGEPVPGAVVWSPPTAKKAKRKAAPKKTARKRVK